MTDTYMCNTETPNRLTVFREHTATPEAKVEDWMFFCLCGCVCGCACVCVELFMEVMLMQRFDLSQCCMKTLESEVFLNILLRFFAFVHYL